MWLILALLLGTPETCYSTEFGYLGDSLGRSRTRHLGRPVDPQHDLGIAHRTLPLGSVVLLHSPSRQTWVFAVVIDRGPYGRVQADGTWVNGADEYRACQVAGRNPLKKSCYSKGSRWRGSADLTPRVVRALRGPDDVQPPGKWREHIDIYPVRGSFVPRQILLQQWGGNV